MSVSRILYIDDDIDLLNVYANYIEDWGYQVDVINSPIKALSRLKEKTQYDVLLVDYNMPEMSGVDFISEVLKSGYVEAKKVSLFSSMAKSSQVYDELKLKIPELYLQIALVDKSVSSLPELKTFLSKKARYAL